MLVDTALLIPMTEANQNFSKVTRTVEKEGMAVILKNNQPRYVVVDFAEYEAIIAAKELRREMISDAAEEILTENLEGFLELAK